MSKVVAITRKIEFDAGHRIPYHESKCRNIHGHRYVLEATVIGSVTEEHNSQHGMVVDFGNLKQILMELIGDRWDHAFLVWGGDAMMLEALAAFPSGKDGHKTVMLNDVPTVENLVRYAGLKLRDYLVKNNSTFKVQNVRLYETPNCWADWSPEMGSSK